MLHKKGLIGILYSPCYYLIFDKSSVYKIILILLISSCKRGLSDIAPDRKTVYEFSVCIRIVYRDNVGSCFLSIDVE